MSAHTLKVALEKNTLLTRREKEIMQIANKGLGNKTIAEELSISLGTVKKHFDNIFRKLDVKNKIEALHKIKIS